MEGNTLEVLGSIVASEVEKNLLDASSKIVDPLIKYKQATTSSDHPLEESDKAELMYRIIQASCRIITGVCIDRLNDIKEVNKVKNKVKDKSIDCISADEFKDYVNGCVKDVESKEKKIKILQLGHSILSARFNVSNLSDLPADKRKEFLTVFKEEIDKNGLS